jgi:hypothetical protein
MLRLSHSLNRPRARRRSRARSLAVTVWGGVDLPEELNEASSATHSDITHPVEHEHEHD